MGLHEGRPFIVMELLEGTTLADRLERGALPVAELLDLAVQLADALSAAHAKGIVHRDLKPGNVFLTDSGLLKVLDFGVAKLQREPSGQTTSVHGRRLALLDEGRTGSTEPGLILGTLAYMSPEQARGWEIDARSDLFSFGAVLYGSAWILGFASAWRALYDGDLDAADRAAQASLAYGTERRIPWVFHAHHIRGVIALYRDRQSEALECMRRAVELETPSAWSGVACAWLFWALAHGGDRDALLHLSEHRPPLPSPGKPSLFGAWASLALVVEGLAWLGEREELARLDVHAEALVATGVACYGSALFRTVAGTTAAACGDWGRAQAHYEVALEQSASVPYRHAEPQVRSSYAEMLRERNATGDRERARSLLEEAIASNAALGMPAFERRARERLAAL